MSTFGMDLLLDIKRRRVDDEIAPVLLVLAAPDQLRIEVSVARIVDLFRVLLLLLQYGLEFSRGNVFPLGFIVREDFDRLFRCGLSGHDYFSVCQSSGVIFESRLATASIAPCSDAQCKCSMKPRALFAIRRFPPRRQDQRKRWLPAELQPFVDLAVCPTDDSIPGAAGKPGRLCSNSAMTSSSVVMIVPPPS